MRRLSLVVLVLCCAGCGRDGGLRGPADGESPPPAAGAVSEPNPSPPVASRLTPPEDLAGMPAPGPPPPGHDKPSAAPRYVVKPLWRGIPARGDRFFRNTDGLVFPGESSAGPGAALDLNEKGDVLRTGQDRTLTVGEGPNERVLGVAADWHYGAGINDVGDLATTCDTGETDQRRRGRPVRHAFLIRGTTKTDLGSLRPGLDSAAVDVNNRREVIGVSGARGFIWRDGTMTDLGMLPGYESARPVAINNKGQVVGTLTGSQDVWANAFERAFLWQDGRMYGLPGPADATMMFGVDINDRGDAIGYAYYMHAMPDSITVPLLWRAGRYYDLNDIVVAGTGYEITKPHSIDEKGVILATAVPHTSGETYRPSHKEELVLLTPATGSEKPGSLVVRTGDRKTLPPPTTAVSPPAKVAFSVEDLNVGEGYHWVINDRGQIAGTIEPKWQGYVISGKRRANLGRWDPGYQEVINIGADGSVLFSIYEGAVLWKGGKGRALPGIPGDTNAANDRHEIVGERLGFRHLPDGNRRPEYTDAFVWRAGRTTALPPLPGRKQARALDINNKGQVAGSSDDRAVLWTNGVPRDLGLLPGCKRAIAFKVNDRGQVAGVCYKDADIRYATWKDAYGLPFLWDNGRMKPLGLPKGVFSVIPSDINERGDVVGYGVSADRGMSPPAIAWLDGHPYDLNTLLAKSGEWDIIHAYGINSRREIVAGARKRDNPNVAEGSVTSVVVLRPVPRTR